MTPILPQATEAILPEPRSSLTLQHAVRRAMTGFKWLQEKSLQKSSSRRMRVTETVSLGEKRMVSILQVDGTQLLIGASGSSVSLLAILDQEQGKWRAAAAGMEKPA
jgi:flagellar biogenesis protein FliO